MSNIEDVLRQFRPAPEPEGFWDRVQKGRLPDRGKGPQPRRWAWAAAAAAAALFAGILSLVTASPRFGGAPLAPEEALARIRTALLTSETACIRFSLEPDTARSPGAPSRKTGVVFLKQGNKVNLSVKEWGTGDPQGVPETEARVISDGKRMERCLLRRGKEVSAEAVGPRAVAQGLTEWFLGAGNLASWPAVVELEASEPIRDLRNGPETPGARVLSYTTGKVAVTLTYDPVTYKVLRRVLRSENIGTVTETFQEYEFNEEMPDSYFVLATEK
jgi:outer membrane lipoprotein-sorting protein